MPVKHNNAIIRTLLQYDILALGPCAPVDALLDVNLFGHGAFWFSFSFTPSRSLLICCTSCFHINDIEGLSFTLISGKIANVPASSSCLIASRRAGTTSHNAS